MNKWVERNRRGERRVPGGEAERGWEELPVCGISGLALAANHPVAAVGRIEEDGGLPRHLFDHACSGPACKLSPQLEPHLPRSPATGKGRESQGVSSGLQAWHLCSAWAKTVTLDNKVTTNAVAIGSIMRIDN